MSRAAKLDHEFNKEKFAEMLKLAIGDRWQQTFAEECGLSTGHINRYANCQKEQPPMPSTIWKIAAYAQNNITYEDLMDAAGYDYRKYEKPQDDKIKAKVETNSAYCTAVIKSIIVSDLSSRNLKWTALSAGETVPYDFGIKLEGDFFDEWYFAIYPSTRSKEESGQEDMQKRLFTYYGALVFKQSDRKVKLSFVTDSEEEYTRIKMMAPKTLATQVSAILIDMENLCMSKEEELNAVPETEGSLVAEKISYDAKEQE